MRKNKVSRPSVVILVSMALMITIGCLGCATPEKSAQTKADSSTPSARVSATPKEAPSTLSAVSPQMAPAAPFYPTPTNMDLCGEPVPLHSQDVFERFDKEFTIIVYNHAQVYLWLKRMERYFPWIEERLRRYGLPDDLKYVVIAESDLVPNVASNKGAAGPWQFMPSTGSSYGLQQRGSFDGRYDFERSTEGALRLLEDLRKRHNSWAIAIAAYNCGDKRIFEEARAQRVTDYYHMKLPQETERYVFRILAIKAVLGNPGQYGYSLPKGQGYPEHRLDRVTISLSSPLPIQTAAENAGITFREFKRLNPTFRSDSIPAGTFEIKLPEGKGTVFEQNHGSARTQTASLATASASPVEEEPSRSGSVESSLEGFQAGTCAPNATRQDDPPTDMSGARRASTQELRQESGTKVKEEGPAKPQRVSSANSSGHHQSEGTTKRASAPKNQVKSSASRNHQVKKGETLSEIAKMHQVSVQELQQANKIKGKDVKLGQKLVIP
jgi:membrane-bound lytic murein transglycosylase D